MGAGISVSGSNSLIRGNIFEGNIQKAGGYGAAIGGSGTSPIIENNIFRGNTSDYQWLSGVVSFVNSSSPLIANNIFVNNSSNAISLTLPSGNRPRVINNTIVNNRIGIRVDTRVNQNTQVFQNNILVGNQDGLRIEHGWHSNYPTWEYNLVFANTRDYVGIPDQTGTSGNIAVEPFFANPSAGDYHLLPLSPCTNTGNPTGNYIGQTDIDGQPRMMGGRVDMGADEVVFSNIAPAACVSGGDRIIEAEGSFGARLTLDGSCSSDVDSSPGTNDDIEYFDWYKLDPCDSNDDQFLGDGEIVDCNLPLGEHNIILEVTDKAGAFDTNEVTVIVQDTTPPDFNLSVTPTTLWPPNRKMIEITPARTVSDICDDSPEVLLMSITMSEGGEVINDWHTNDNVQVNGIDSIYLRAQRGGAGGDRIYTITYKAVDDSGNVTVQSVTVVVPHDQGK